MRHPLEPSTNVSIRQHRCTHARGAGEAQRQLRASDGTASARTCSRCTCPKSERANCSQPRRLEHFKNNVKREMHLKLVGFRAISDYDSEALGGRGGISDEPWPLKRIDT